MADAGQGVADALHARQQPFERERLGRAIVSARLQSIARQFDVETLVAGADLANVKDGVLVVHHEDARDAVWPARPEVSVTIVSPTSG